MSSRRIAYITGTRADFGLMRSTLELIRDAEGLDLSVIVTGTHLADTFGATETEIASANLAVSARIPVNCESLDGALMAKNIGLMLIGLQDALSQLKPDIVLLLGDRGEMLAGAIAAIHLNIPAVHIHGGERSGTVDEPVRHAISKLAFHHCVSTEESRDRLLRMGEHASSITLVGAPGLDGILEDSSGSVGDALSRHDLKDGPYGILLYHPVVEELDWTSRGLLLAAEVMRSEGLQVIALQPNSDAGNADVLAAMQKLSGDAGTRIVPHVTRRDFLTLMRHARVLVGNSSGGVIEAASFGTPVVNIGVRQNLRQRNANTIDVAADDLAVRDGILNALNNGRFPPFNVYGDGKAGARIVEVLRELMVPPLVTKINAC